MSRSPNASACRPRHVWLASERSRRQASSPSGVTLLDAAKLGPSLSVFIQVTLEKQIEEMLESFEQSIKRFPEVMECYLMTGDSDYLLARGGSRHHRTPAFHHRAADESARRRQHQIELCLETGQIQNGASGERAGPSSGLALQAAGGTGRGQRRQMKITRQCLASSNGTVLLFFRSPVGFSDEFLNAHRTDFSVESERVSSSLSEPQSRRATR